MDYLKGQERNASDFEAPELAAVPGGVAIRSPSDGAIVGGIGVRGLPSGASDEAVIRKRIEAMGI